MTGKVRERVGYIDRKVRAREDGSNSAGKVRRMKQGVTVLVRTEKDGTQCWQGNGEEGHRAGKDLERRDTQCWQGKKNEARSYSAGKVMGRRDTVLAR